MRAWWRDRPAERLGKRAQFALWLIAGGALTGFFTLLIAIGAARTVPAALAGTGSAAQPQGSVELITVAEETATFSRLISYQGRLLNPGNGQPKPDGAYSMGFSLFDVPSGGSALWSETQPAVQVSRGAFTALLGQVTPFPANLFDGRDLWLGLLVNGESLGARVRIANVPYAMFAQGAGNAATAGNAGLLDGLDSTAFFKGNYGTQVADSCSQLAPLGVGQSQLWTSHSKSPAELIVWQARAATEGVRLNIATDIEIQPSSGGLLRYWLTVTNNGGPANAPTCYSITRFTLVQ